MLALTLVQSTIVFRQAPIVAAEDCSTPGVSCDSHGCRLDKGEKWCNSSQQCISGDLPAFCADPPDDGDDDNPQPPQTGRCQVANPNAACSRITNTGGANLSAIVANAARNNPGRQFMAWCDLNTGQVIATEAHFSECGCPTLTTNGGMVTGTCGVCDNPTAIYRAQQTPPQVPPQVPPQNPPPGTPPPVTPPPPVNPPPNTPGIDVEKTVVGGQTTYPGGSAIQFRITVTNTGQTTHNTVRLEDSYNPSYLDYVSISGQRTGGNVVDLTGVASVNEISGQIVIANLAAANALGALAPGQQYVITMNFITRAAVDRTCNNVYVRTTTGGPEDRDDACVGIQPPNTGCSSNSSSPWCKL